MRERCARAGHAVGDVEIDHAAWTPDVYLHIVLPEAAWYHAPLLDDARGSATRRACGCGWRWGATCWRKTTCGRCACARLLGARVDKALEGLRRAAAADAADGGAAARRRDGRRRMASPEPVRAAMLRLTQLFNITGHPAIAMPAGDGADGLPRSLQLVGTAAGTERLLDVAAAVERQITGGPGSVGGGTG